MELEQLDPMIPSPIDPDENIPNTIFYRSWGASRNTPAEVRAGIDPEIIVNEKRMDYESPNFGTFSGVFMRCILSILSAVYYLRLGWVVGNCGLPMTLLLIFISNLATTLTTLSLSAVVSNGLVKGGGVYYFISRSLGADWGGTIGVVFSFATAFSAVLHVFSFTDVIHQWSGKTITPNGDWDYAIICNILAIAITVLICFSLTLESKFEYLYTLLIAISLLGFFFGLCNPNTPRWTISNLKSNLNASYLPGQTFFTVFAVFFPSCTGIMAGANISGDLADPQRSIPIGTLGAIAVTTLLNMVTAIILASAAPKDVLLTDYAVMCNVSVWGPLVFLGIIGAAISSATASLIGGPKTFQSLCQDKILPKIFDFFAVGKKSTNDPVRGFILAYLITAVCTFIFKDLNAVSTILTNFFLVSFAMICIACLVGSMSKSASWRPSWKWHHPVLDVLGAGMMIAGMFLIDWVMSLCTIAVCVVVFCYFHWSDRATNNWGEFPQSLLFTDIVEKVGKLNSTPEHVKTYRPLIEYVFNFSDQADKQIANIVPFKQITEKSYSLLGVSLVGETNDVDVMKNFGGMYVHPWGTVSEFDCARLIGNVVGYGRISPNIVATSFRPTEDLYKLVCGSVESNLAFLIARNFEIFDVNVENHFPLDIWWLMDDGGLTLLVGYLLSIHDSWKMCPIRLFTVIPKNQLMSKVQVKLSRLLHLLRIQAEIIVIGGIEQEPLDETMQLWNDLGIKVKDDTDMRNIKIYLRLRELILQNSENSSLIISTIPIPKVDTKPELWINLINFVSANLPPFVWCHGNNQNVVTFSA